MSSRSTVCGCVKRVDARFQRRMAQEIPVSADVERSPIQNLNLDAVTLRSSARVGMDDRAATLLTLVSTGHRNELDVYAYLKDALDQLLSGSMHHESLRADVCKTHHPEFIPTYRSEQRRDVADRRRLTRAQRRLANLNKQNAT